MFSLRYFGLDFETRSRVDLKKRGLDNYVRCPYFDVTVMACQENADGAQMHFADNPSAIKDLLYPLLSDPSVQFICHNALFEYVVCCKMAERWGLPAPALSRFWCSSALGQSYGFAASLESLSSALLGEHKLASGMYLIETFGKWNVKANRFLNRYDEPELWGEYVSYCCLDVSLTLRCWNALPKYNPEIRRYWLSVARMNLRGFPLDLVSIHKILNDIDMIKADAEEVTKAITKGVVEKPSQGAKLIEWLGTKGLSTKSIATPIVEKWLADPTLPDEARKLLEARMKHCKSTYGKYLAFAMYASEHDGRNRHGFWYPGTHTGRCSGKGSQPQNMTYDKTGQLKESAAQLVDMFLENRLPTYKDKSFILVNMIRGVIKAEKGKQLYDVDYAAIEARIQVWLVDDTEKLEQYFRNEDLYKPMAAFVLSKSVSLVTKEERNGIGKPCVLGCGYGMGAAMFSKKYNVPLAIAQECVDAWRKRYPKVVSYWDDLEGAFIACMKHRKPSRAGKVYFRPDVMGGKKYVVCVPPGGREIWYCDPGYRVHFGKYSLTYWRHAHNGGYYVKLWGGTLLENICQNIAGYIISHGQFHVEALGVVPILQTHDQLTGEVPADIDKELASRKFDEAMVDVPGLDGLPIAVESEFVMRFGK
jgi:DNA polymerase